MLLVVGDREPVFDELDAGAHQHLFELGHGAEELLVLVVGAKAHHAFDARAVVPAAVEQHDLTRCRQVRRIALEVPLRALAVVRRGQGGHAAHARVEPLRDALDHATLAGGVAAFEQDDHLVPGVHDPVLQLDQLALEAEQLLEVPVPVGFFFGAERAQAVGVDVGELAVFEFQLQLLVVAVDEVAVDALQQRFLVGQGLGAHVVLPWLGQTAHGWQSM